MRAGDRRRAGRRAHPQGGKDEPEGRALARLAVDVELTAMALHDVLDDRQSQPGAARLARAAAVDAIEALGEPRQVDACNPRTAVDDGDLAAAAVGALPRHGDPSAVRRVADRVADEVPERALQLALG